MVDADSREFACVGRSARPLLADGSVGQHDFRHGPGRRGHRQAEGRAVPVPGRLNAAIGRIVDGLGPRQPTTRSGVDPKAPVGGVVVEQGDAGDVVVQERDHCALAVVVQGLTGTTLVIDALPRLPDGCCPRSTMASQEGGLSRRSSSYATERWPVSASTGNRQGVTRNPVDRGRSPFTVFLGISRPEARLSQRSCNGRLAESSQRFGPASPPTPRGGVASLEPPGGPVAAPLRRGCCARGGPAGAVHLGLRCLTAASFHAAAPARDSARRCAGHARRHPGEARRARGAAGQER